jgi:hypothetical protein
MKDHFPSELQTLLSLPINEVSAFLDNLSVETLEHYACQLYDNERYIERAEIERLLRIILEKRSCKLNETFLYNKDTVNKIKDANDWLSDAFNGAYQKVLKIASELEAEIKAGDTFLNDYEISIDVHPYIKKYDYPLENNFALVLSEPLYNCTPINYFFIHHRYAEIKEDIPIFLDKALTFNAEHCGYCVHVLGECGWSVQDVLAIDHVWADVHVDYQHNEQKK